MIDLHLSDYWGSGPVWNGMEICMSGVLLISYEAVKVSKSEEKADKETRFEARQAATYICLLVIIGYIQVYMS